VQLSSNLYPYLRWIWIQFPWIGLHSAPDVAMALKQQRIEEEKHRCVECFLFWMQLKLRVAYDASPSC
jgi:hypothetical protein